MNHKKQFNNNDNFITICKRLYDFSKSARQRRLKIPTDPKEIHRRADLIRAQLEADKRRAWENRKIQEDLALIKFDAQMKEANKKENWRLVKKIIKSLRKKA